MIKASIDKFSFAKEEGGLRMKMTKKVLLFLAICTLSKMNFAWGKLGHSIVVELTKKYLTSSELKKWDKVLPLDSWAEASTWADEVRRQAGYTHTKSWHYLNWEKDKKVTPEVMEAEEENVLMAIQKQVDVLNSSKATDQEKTIAFKFLIHFVGDLHQPLHVGYGEDRGGNTVRVRWMKKMTNLHEVWDVEMLTHFDYSMKKWTDELYLLDGNVQSTMNRLDRRDLVTWANSIRNYLPTIYDYDESGVLDEEYFDADKKIVMVSLNEAAIHLALILKKINL